MKRLFAVIALLTVVCGSRAETKKYPSPYVISRGEELPRTVFVSYRNREHAFQNDFDSSQYFVNLNGSWNFRRLMNCPNWSVRSMNSNNSSLRGTVWHFPGPGK